VPDDTRSSRGEADAGVARALAAVGGGAADPAVDALADPGGARRSLQRLEASGWLLLRAASPLDVEAAAGKDAASQAYAPAPRDPVWVRLQQGSPAVTTAPLRFVDGGEAAERRVLRVSVERAQLRCCASPSCTIVKVRAAAWLELEPLAGAPEQLLVAEALDVGEGAALARLEPCARALADVLGVSLVTSDGSEIAQGSAPAEVGDGAHADHALSASALGRFALRSEGRGVVLRDHGSAGPRGRAGRLLLIAAVLGAVALALWAMLVVGLQRDGGTGVLLGIGVVAGLLSLTAYAFFGVGRFAMRYAARSAPLLWVGDGRVTAMPWVARDGRVDLRPEGRFGASIPTGEVRGAAVRSREQGFVIELDTDHGPIDVLSPTAEPVAAFWCAAITRAIADAAHPEPKASARQRARARVRGG
jgi:hypothetical protein